MLGTDSFFFLTTQQFSKTQWYNCQTPEMGFFLLNCYMNCYKGPVHTFYFHAEFR